MAILHCACNSRKSYMEIIVRQPKEDEPWSTFRCSGIDLFVVLIVIIDKKGVDEELWYEKRCSCDIILLLILATTRRCYKWNVLCIGRRKRKRERKKKRKHTHAHTHMEMLETLPIWMSTQPHVIKQYRENMVFSLVLFQWM